MTISQSLDPVPRPPARLETPAVASAKPASPRGAPSVLEQIPWLRKHEPPRMAAGGRLYPIAKRGLDLVLVTLAAPLLVPLLIGCAVSIKLDDPRAPVFFRQLRTGRGGRRFVMFKLRTMVRDAEDRKHALAASSDRRWPDFKLRHDPRVTRVGRWLRRTSLDELPQLLNVVRGEMSLVGPRPTSFGAETYADWQLPRLDATPGVTGLWQVSLRGSSEFDERVWIDLAYIERRSLRLDLEILARTVPVLLRGDRGGW